MDQSFSIKPDHSDDPTWRTGTILGLTAKDIAERIGIAPGKGDGYKVVNSWRFTVDGVRCAVWDYKGSHKANQFSAFGPIADLSKVFGNHVSAGF